MRDEAIANVRPLVKAVARRVAKDWDGIAEPEDVENEIWMELLAESGEDYVITLAGLDAPSRQSALNRIGRHVAERMREDYYTFSGNYTYDADEVRALLEMGALEDWDGMATTLLHSEVVDIQIGMDRLNERNSEYWAAIINYYKLALPLDGEAGKKRIQRAREALTREMNGARRVAEVEYQGR